MVIARNERTGTALKWRSCGLTTAQIPINGDQLVVERLRGVLATPNLGDPRIGDFWNRSGNLFPLAAPRRQSLLYLLKKIVFHIAFGQSFEDHKGKSLSMSSGTFVLCRTEPI